MTKYICSKEFNCCKYNTFISDKDISSEARNCHNLVKLYIPEEENYICSLCGRPFPAYYETETRFGFIREEDIRYCYFCGKKIEKKN